MKLPALCLAVLALAGCPSKSKAPGGPTTDKPLAWADMDHEQKEDYMEATVMPHMKDKFTAFDARYAEMNCKTCHGPGADDGTFKMPNPDLMPLDFSRDPSTYSEEEHKVGEFMGTVVVPEMAKLLGTTPYDQATQTGFGCTGCHTVKSDK